MADCLNNEEAINSQLSSTNTDAVSSNLDVDNGVSSELVGSNDMTSSIEGEEATTALLNEEEPLDSVLDQSTTAKYNGGETDNIVVSVDNSTHTITATLKPIKFKTVADFPVVGSDRLLYIDSTENSLYSWDSDLGEYRKLVADTGDIEIDLDDYYTKTETDTRYGASIEFGIDNSTYIITAQLKDANGNNLGVAKTIDLPLESVVVNGSYDSTTKEVVLTLDNGSEIKFSVADLVSGLQSEITATNKLASDLVDDTNSVNKFVTQGEKDKLAGIEEGANKTVVDSEFSGTSTNPLQNKLITEKFRDVVWKTTDQTINSVKTFEKQPKIAESITESMAGRYIVSAERIQKFLRENYQEILVAGNNITFDGNTISANLEGSSPIVTLTSPVVIYDLPSGVYQLPAGCELYCNDGDERTVTYDNTAVTLMIVNSITNPDSRVDKLFYLFAEADGQTESTVGTGGSFIVGKVKSYGGSYHIVGTNLDYVGVEDDGWIGGNKSFLNPVKYYHQYESLDTSLNDRTLVDAQWVKAQSYLNESELAGKGYLTSIPSEYVTETELAGKGYLKSAPVSSVNSKTGAVSLTARDVGALSDYTLTINHQSAGNPRMVKFVSVNYATSATCFKMGAMTCHDNGISYQFLTDMLIAVTTAGEVTANIYKFAQSSVGNVDGVARYTGDVFYVNDTTNKIVDFYILCGQYSSSQFTPVTKVGSTTIAYVTQYTGTATYYSSGTKIWVNGCGSTYARTSDIPDASAFVTTDTTQTITGAKAFRGQVENAPTEAGVYLGLNTDTVTPNANIAIISPHTATHIDMGRPNVDYDFRLIKWNGISGNVAQMCYSNADGGAAANITIPRASGTLALTSDIPSMPHLYQHIVYGVGGNTRVGFQIYTSSATAFTASTLCQFIYNSNCRATSNADTENNWFPVMGGSSSTSLSFQGASVPTSGSTTMYLSYVRDNYTFGSTSGDVSGYSWKDKVTQIF